jgi:predicted permease
VPGFTAAGILTLAVAIGISTAVFSVVDNILTQPLPLPDSEQLVSICEVQGSERDYCTASPANVLDWQDNARSLSAAGVARRRGVIVHEGGQRSLVNAAVATPGFLEALGVAPLHGRLLNDQDGPPFGTGRAIVLGHELWQSRFGGEPSVIGSTFRGSSDGDGGSWHDVPVTIVGVLPPQAQAPTMPDVEAWIPFQFDPRTEEHRDWRGFQAIGRLADGVSVSTAGAELNRIQLDLGLSYPAAVRGWRVELARVRDRIVEHVRPLLRLFLAAVALVMLIACVNLMSFMLAHASTRDRELTVRAALGAARRRILAQLVLEAGLIALIGSGAGVILAWWLVDGFTAIAPPGLPRLDEVGLDGRALLFTTALMIIVTILGGIAPLTRIRTLRLYDILRSSTGGTADHRVGRMRNALVSIQIALSLALVLAAGLLMRSFQEQSTFDPGFRLPGLLTFQVYPPGSRYDSPERRAAFYARLEEELAAVPGVVGVGTASSAPFLGGGDGRTPFLVAGRDPVPVDEAPTVEWYDAGPGFFPTLGVPLLHGRNLSDSDQWGARPAALVNRAMATRHWPGGSPVGAVLSLPGWNTEVEVVGVVEDMRSLEAPAPVPSIFVSNRQRPRGATFYVIRTADDALNLLPAVRTAVARLDDEVEPYSLMTMQERLHARLVGPRFNLLIVSLFGTLALALTAFGLYTVVAYTVTLRRREFGIRMALGAQRVQVLAAVFREGARLLGLGIVGGTLGAIYFSRLLGGLLYGVGPTDPRAVAGAAALLVLTCVAACVAPALRASRVQPVSVMRDE